MCTKNRDRYRELALQLLPADYCDIESREPQFLPTPLGLPGWDEVHRTRNAGDLSDANEQRLAIRVCELMKMPPDWWAKLSEADRIEWLEAALAAKSNSDTEAKKSTPTDGERQPRKLLTGWHEITAELDMKYSDQDKIKSLNKRFEGPIKNNGKGTKPLVYSDELLAWWDTLAAKQQELANQRDGRQLSAERQHNYGREGQVAPEIAGSVKKRRRRAN
jgi:hypothetical protein